MSKINKILFPTDFSECADHALTLALMLARMYHANLHMLNASLLHAEDPYNPAHHFPDIEELQKTLKDMAIDQMNSSIKSKNAEDVRIQKVQERAMTAAPFILEYANDNRMDLIVMGTHGRTGISHFLLGSVAEKVVRFAPIPVLTTHNEFTKLQFENILIPVDFSDNSKAAITWGKKLARDFGSKITYLHVIEQESHPEFYNISFKPLLDTNPGLKERIIQNLKKFAKASDTDGIFTVSEGMVHKEVKKYAESNHIDLVVMATHGMSGLEHFLLGSTTERIIRIAPCPVLTVRPKMIGG